MVMQGDKQMARARKQTKTTKETTPGFAIKINPQTELGLAMLIAETEDGHYEPVAVVASVSEAQEIAKSDFARRLEGVAMGCEDVTCPARYAIWAQGLGGEYKPLREYEIDGTAQNIEW
jgi:hypothetical protein